MADLKVRHQEEISEARSRVASLQSQLSEKGKQYLEEITQLKQVYDYSIFLP